MSGPQVVEGWYGAEVPQAAGPHPRVRRHHPPGAGPARRRCTSDGPHYPLPLTGEGTTGLGKTLKPITHPLRADIPIMLGAEGPKNVALAAEICDGWLPIFYSPRLAGMYNEWLDEGFARPGRATHPRGLRDLRDRAGRRHRRPRRPIIELMKPHLALYMGGMGAEDTNFHADVYRRMGYAEVVDDVTKLFRIRTARTRPPRSFPTNSSTTPRSSATSTTCRKQIKAWEAAGRHDDGRRRARRRADPRGRRAGLDTRVV